MTGCERVLARLRKGPASHLELYQLGVIAHSRIADLRRKGYQIGCERDGDLYVYSLLEETASAAAVSSSREAHPADTADVSAPPSPGETAPEPPPALVPGQVSLFEVAA